MKIKNQCIGLIGLCFGIFLGWKMWVLTSVRTTRLVKASGDPFPNPRPDSVSTTTRAVDLLRELPKRHQKLKETETALNRVAEAIAKEQGDFDQIRTQTLQKTAELQGLQEQVNQSLIDEEDSVKVQMINARLESEAKNLQGLQREMNIAYSQLQLAKQKIIDEIVIELP